MLKDSEILQFINDDASNEKKRNAKLGERYYEGEHDIKQYKLYYYNSDGELVEDKTRSNIKIPHPFFTEIVDQEVQYLLSGKDGYVKSDNPEIQKKMDIYFNDNENFTSELYEVLTGTVSKGFEYMYAYKNAEDRLDFQCADSIGVIEVRKKDTDDGCEYVIYWYVDRVEKGTKKIKRIQVWDDKETHFYVMEDDGKLLKDDSKEVNPRPHTLYKKDGSEDTYFEGFGFIPFFRLDNSQKQVSGLKPIKELIDDYDLMSCGLSNNLQDASEYLVVVSGFQGDDLEQLIQNTKTKKHIGVETGGNVDYKTVNIPYEARRVKLGMDETNIYRFGMGLNSAQIGDGNITNVVIKSRYALLDMKCNKIEIRLRQFMRKILKVVIAEINEKDGTDFQIGDVYFDFKREVMTNAQDNATIELTDAQKKQVQISTLLDLAQIVDDVTVLEIVCEILEIEYDVIAERVKEQKESEAQEIYPNEGKEVIAGE